MHIDDTALAHLLAIENPAVSDGQRYLLSAGTWSFEKMILVLREKFPERKDKIIEGLYHKLHPACARDTIKE